MTGVMAFPPSRIVETSYGKVRGRRLIYEGSRQVDAFQGIPFAAPPIGELRFKKPQSPSPWSGVLETSAFGPLAIQSPKFNDHAINEVMSEDCLYLNVFTPCWTPPTEGFPVMFFIHAGGFECGDATKFGDEGICENIVTRDIVFITIHYRLGYLGFFTTGDSVCPGNFGLWDQTAALKWVQENIGAFGGDKNNVTVLGPCAGGASADFLHLSPHSTGLFHKMICLAGSAEMRWVINENMPEQSRNKARRLGVTWNSNAELIANLRKLPAEQFAVNTKKRDKEKDAFMETVVYIDGDFLPESIDALRAKAKPKPMITGVTREEGLIMMLFVQLDQASDDYFLNVVSYSANEEQPRLAKALSRRFDTHPVGSEAYVKSLVNLISDYFYNAGTLELCRKTVDIQKEPVYLYVFEHFNPEVLGSIADALLFKDVTHTCELFYLFKISNITGQHPEINATEQRVIDQFTTAFTNFAKFGNPNGGGKGGSELPILWEPATNANCSRNFVFATDGCSMSEDFFQGRTEEFVRIVKEYSGGRLHSSL